MKFQKNKLKKHICSNLSPRKHNKTVVRHQLLVKKTNNGGPKGFQNRETSTNNGVDFRIDFRSSILMILGGFGGRKWSQNQ